MSETTTELRRFASDLRAMTAMSRASRALTEPREQYLNGIDVTAGWLDDRADELEQGR